MNELYKKIVEANPNQCNLVLTAIGPNHVGKKAFWSGNGILWETPGSHFFSDHLSEAKRVCDGGNYGCRTIQIGGDRVFCETLGGQKHLVICGAGHVSIPIIKIGMMLDFEVTVIDDRPAFADCARRTGADHVICDSFEHTLTGIKGNRDTYFVIVTRGHRHDQKCLRVITEKEYAYIGIIGSLRRIAMVKQILKEERTKPKALEELHSPIGLKIGAQTPEEIAVAIIAEKSCLRYRLEKREC